MYGPRTTLIYYNDAEDAVNELTLTNGEWVLSKSKLKIDSKGKMFSPGNLRAS